MTAKPTCEELEKRVQKLELLEFEHQRAVQELHASEERISKISECFIHFTPDAIENINRLTSLCGEFFGATCALYNRLDQGLLCSWGQWNTPPDYSPVDKPDGHICYDVIKNASDRVLVVSKLQESHYARTDPNVVPFKLQTYVGKAVKFFDTYLGSLCVVFQDDFVPSAAEKKLMGIIATAIGVEEERKQAKENLRHQTEMHKILMNISSKYINVPLDEVGGAINAALGEIGEFVSADRAYVFNYDFEKNIAVNIYEWCNKSIEPQIAALQSSPLEAAPDWVESHLKGEPVVVTDISALPAGDLRDILEQQQIKSLITVPMFHEEKLIGFSGFDSVKKSHVYSDMEIELIRFYGQIVINLGMRIQSEKSFQKSEERFRSVLMDLPIMVNAVDQSNTIVFWNRKCEEITGYTATEMLGNRNAMELIYPDREYLKTELKNAELILKAKDGSAKTVLWTNPDFSTPEWLWAVGIDVTDRKWAEAALGESEEKYRSMMEAMKDAAYICSQEYRIEYMNPAMIHRTGRDATNEICHRVLYNNDEKCSWCRFNQVQQGEHVEYELSNPEDNRYYSTSNSPIYNTDGSVSKLTIFRDVTQVRKMERQLRQTQKMEAISALSGGIAHQFNNALSGITGNIDLLEIDFSGDETVGRFTRAIKNSADRMTKLTAQLLAYAKGGKYLVKNMSLSAFVKETLPLLKHTIDSAINVDTDIPPGILNVEADPAQMQMVLSAVLTNASEALEGKGRIRIACKNEQITDETAENHPGLKPGNYACLTVSDDGKGMDEETRDRIFEPFFTTKFEGRGLGMAAAYGIVKNHDGWISVDSELGRGTVVKICLPVVEISAKKRAKSKTELIKGTGTILVIEDEKPIMDVTRSILERLGYHVLEAETGQMAINVVQSFDGVIDLALLDILLPDMSGDTIYPLLMEARPNLKVIVFSGYAKEGPIQKLLDEGAQDFIEKPFKIAELSQKLKKALKGKQ